MGNLEGFTDEGLVRQGNGHETEIGAHINTDRQIEIL
ncbi:hypothetical protein SDC9_117489 [bioreactor metagenome]|uniref:Uncharacterized protein n=1 Tax=bioreactor metagenome TaxID=1076179 RepID=A0A645C8D3_9ZZZZ